MLVAVVVVVVEIGTASPEANVNVYPSRASWFYRDSCGTLSFPRVVRVFLFVSYLRVSPKEGGWTGRQVEPASST